MIRGFSIIEELIAFALLSIYICSATFFISTCLQALSTIPLRQQAISIALANIHAEFQNNSQSFLDVTSVATSTDGIYQSSVSVELQPNGTTKKLQSYVLWRDGFLQTHQIEIPAFVSDLSIQPDTYECDSAMWSSSTLFTPSQQLFSSLLPANIAANAGSISTLNVASTTLYAIASSTVLKTDPDIFMFDISSSTNPEYEGDLDSAPSTKLGLNSVAISKGYIYAANGSQPNFATCKTGAACSQLQIINSVDPANPTVTTNFQLSTTTAPFATGSEGQSIGKSIAYSEGRVYLGLSKDANTLGDEFNIIDVRNPSSPQWLGGYHVGRSVNRIRIKGAFAYLATDGPQEEVLVVNISDPAHILLVSSFTAPGNSLYGYGKDLTFASSTILLGRSYAQGSSDFMALTLDSQNSLTQLNSEISASSSNPISIESLLSFNDSVYIVTNNDLEFWDLVDTPNPIQKIPSIPVSSLNTNTSIACSGTTLYISSIATTSSSSLLILNRT
jgi:hypothetical protein